MLTKYWTSHGKTLRYFTLLVSFCYVFFLMPFSCVMNPRLKKKNFKNGHTLSNTFKMALQVNFTTTFEISMTLLPSLSFPQVSKPTGHHCLCFFQYREPAHPEYQLISLSFSAAVVTRWDVST